MSEKEQLKTIRTANIAIFIVLLTIGLLLSACGYKESTVNEDIETVNQLPNGEYVLLDVREQHTSAYCYLTFVLSDSVGNRYYYECRSERKKSNEYIQLAKLVPKDKIRYQDGDFVLEK